ncbi:MAG: hypothetical protein AAFX76_00120 [Planctomycetota bacterium]
MRHPSVPLALAFFAAVALHASLLPWGAGVVARAGGGEADRPRAELVAAWVDPSASATQAGSLPARFRVENRGAVDADGLTWSLWLSRDREFDEAQDRRLAFAANDTQPGSSAPLAAGDGLDVRQTAILPRDADGPWFLVVRVTADDAEPAVASTSVFIESARPADVSVSAIDAPAAAVAGGLLPVGYTLTNAVDAGWAAAGWTDTAWLSADQTLQPDQDLLLRRVPRRRPLAPGDSTTVPQAEARLPLNLTPGAYRLVVQTDAGTGATRSVPLRIEPATGPDLAIGAVDFPDEVTLGEVTPLRFNVVNRSPRPTGDTVWGDRVYLSDDDVLSEDDAVLLSVPRMAPLAGVGGYTSGPHGVVIEQDTVASSQMFLILSTDDEDDIAEGRYEDNNTLALAFAVRTPDEQLEAEDLELGREDEPARVTVAWIAHDAFEELRSREAVTLQPLVQERADPTPDASLERDPDDAAEASTTPTRPTPPTDRPAETATPASQQTAASSTRPVPTADSPGNLPVAPAGPIDRAGDAERDAVGSPATTPTQAQAPPPTPRRVPEPRDGEKPTAAPRSDREADPTALVDSDTVRPGGVLVGPGLEVRTFRPRFSAAARVSAIPRNPVAVITFDPADGTVLDARLETSTGFDNVDAPILTSLYRWVATGSRLERMDGPFTIRITILLGGE